MLKLLIGDVEISDFTGAKKRKTGCSLEDLR